MSTIRSACYLSRVYEEAFLQHTRSQVVNFHGLQFSLSDNKNNEKLVQKKLFSLGKCH